MSPRGTALAVRDFILFLTGTGLIIQQMSTHHPDPSIIQVGATISGLPGFIHGFRLSKYRSDMRTESKQSSSPVPVSSAEPPQPSGQSSDTES